MVNAGLHLPAARGSILYVELFGPGEELVSKRNIQIVGGFGIGDFKLPDTLQAGEYLVRAYSRYMQNFDPGFYFTHALTILGSQPANADSRAVVKNTSSLAAVKPEVKLNFFPEGGDMIDGLEGKVAFKATDGWGNSLDISGHVLNSKGEPVTEFKSHRFGLGSFHLRPEAGETYTAQVSYENRQYNFPLLESKAGGYALNIQVHKGKIFLNASNSSSADMDNAFILGHVRGNVFSFIASSQEDRQIAAAFSAREIPSGIAHFTLFDGYGNPQCERLVFIDNPTDGAITAIESKKSQYASREQARFRLNLQDVAGNRLQGRVSVAAIEKSLFSSIKEAGDIRSFLLLNSDLPGDIENPAYYFNRRNKDREYVMDLLMLTQGWRRFVWSDVLKETHEPLAYQPEDGFTLEGRLYDYANRSKAVEGEVTLSFMENPGIRKTNPTSPDGHFQFDGMHFIDTVNIVLQASKAGKKRKRKENDAIFIDILPAESPGIFAKPGPLKLPENTAANQAQADSTDNTSKIPAFSQQYIAKSNKIKDIEAAYNTEGKAIMLEEVAIEARQSPEADPFSKARKLYSAPSNRLVFDSIPNLGLNSIFDIIQGRIPGITLIGSYNSRNVIIRGPTSIAGDNSPLYLVDGVPTDHMNVNAIHPQNVAYVDVLKGTKAAMFGSRGAAGVIAIYTKTGSDAAQEINAPHMGIINIKHPGYYQAREFYTPNYSSKKPAHVKPDFRTTLYWHPDIAVAPIDYTDISFFTSDEKGDYILYIQGITADGRTIVGEKEFSVR